jgi:hypothetical protein
LNWVSFNFFNGGSSVCARRNSDRKFKYEWWFINIS